MISVLSKRGFNDDNSVLDCRRLAISATYLRASILFNLTFKGSVRALGYAGTINWVKGYLHAENMGTFVIYLLKANFGHKVYYMYTPFNFGYIGDIFSIMGTISRVRWYTTTHWPTLSPHPCCVCKRSYINGPACEYGFVATRLLI